MYDYIPSYGALGDQAIDVHLSFVIIQDADGHSPFSTNYQASFKNTVFEKTSQLSNPYGINRAGSFVLWGVNEVEIENCTFNRADLLKDQNTSPEACVILYDASVSCSGSTFSGAYEYHMKLYSANLYAMGSTVENCSFSRKGMYAIYAEGGAGHSFVKNQFVLSLEEPIAIYTPQRLYKLPYGIYLNNSHSFTVVENSFVTSGLSASQAPAGAMNIGVIINNNGTYADKVYKNEFKNVSFGAQALGNNKDQNGNVGLEFRCNTFTGNDMDVYVGLNRSSWLNPGAAGVRKTQGNPNSNNYLLTTSSNLAGNLFSSIVADHTYDFDNAVTEVVNYYHHSPSGTFRTEPTLNNNVNNFDAGKFFNEAVACPTPLIVQPEGDTVNELDYTFVEANTDFTFYSSQVSSLKGQMEQLIDGGNSLALQVEIMFTAEHEYYELYQQLLEESPYLSLETLEELIMLDGFPDLMLRNIFIANPQGGKEPYLIELIIEMHPGMPQQMLDDIETAKDNFGALELLQIEYGNVATNRLTAADRMLHLYKTDEAATENVYGDSKALLQQIEMPYYQYQLADLEYQMGYTSEGDAVLENVTNTYALSEYEVEENTAVNAWFSIKREIADISGFTEDQFTELADLATVKGPTAALARSVLAFHEVSVDYEAPMVIPEGISVDKKATSETVQPDVVYNNTLYPNPAADYFTIEIDKQLYVGAMTITVSDLSGKVILTQGMTEQAVYVSTKDFIDGVYLVQVKAEEAVLMTKKVIVSKQ